MPLHRIEIPDSPLCTAASELAHEVYAPFLRNHVLRSYAFADAVGRASARSYDRELLYVATVLHDLGLTDVVPVATRFEVEGADAARSLLAAQGRPLHEQELVWDAIALHTTQVIPQRKAPEIALCQLGTAVDVGFAPRHLVPEPIVQEALARFPRERFKTAMVDALCGLLHRNEAAAASSYVVAEAGERQRPGFHRAHFCDVIADADFTE